jgi:hypothetical protein
MHVAGRSMVESSSTKAPRIVYGVLPIKKRKRKTCYCLRSEKAGTAALSVSASAWPRPAKNKNGACQPSVPRRAHGSKSVDPRPVRVLPLPVRCRPLTLRDPDPRQRAGHGR